MIVHRPYLYNLHGRGKAFLFTPVNRYVYGMLHPFGSHDAMAQPSYEGKADLTCLIWQKMISYNLGKIGMFGKGGTDGY
jgi:hypothetical protein